VKYIAVERCSHCPEFTWPKHSKPVCDLTKEKIDDSWSIPEHCPLPDLAQDKNNE